MGINSVRAYCDFIKAQEVIATTNPAEIDFMRAYAVTTENIAGYSDKFDFVGNTYCTVGSSCDQAFEAILRGASRVDVVDICPFVEYFYYFKVAAILTLSREDFIRFFSIFSGDLNLFPGTFGVDGYRKIRDAIDNPSVKRFWDELFSKYGAQVLADKLLMVRPLVARYFCTVVSYLSSDEKYEELRRLLNKKLNIDFFVKDIFNGGINNTYDNINLSNLHDYCCGSIDKVIRLWLGAYEKLNAGGTMLLGYLYLGRNPDNLWYQILWGLANESFEESFIYPVISTSSIRGHGGPYDMALMCRK